MSTGSGPPLSTTKSLSSVSTSSLSSARLQHSSALSAEIRRTYHRRSDSTASLSRKSLATPRNSQASKKSNKRSGKPKLADEDALAESAIMKAVNNRRGESITHLMQFSLPPRPQYDPRRNHYSRFAPQRRTWGVGSGHHAVDKARYVNANYRFVVDPRKNYEAQALDPNATVEWDSVLQILVSARTQDSSCPICLESPVAARMARCGHVFCLPCLSRYMHSTDDQEPRPERRNRCKSCPICHDVVYMHEARPVKYFVGQENEPPMEGQDVILRLMVSSPGRALALPRECAGDLVTSDDVPSRSAAEVMDYARIMKGSQDYMHLEYERELEELRMQEEADSLMFEEDPQWTQRAIRSVREAQQRLDQIGDPPVPTSLTRPRAITKQSKGAESGSNENPLSTDLARLDIAIESAADRSDGYRYFYQGLLHNYLAALDVRILRTAFGQWSNFPSTILPRVMHVSTGHVVDEVLKKRSKFLAHLPIGCEVTFLECDWTDIVSADVLQQFGPELEKRQKRNQEKEVREERDRLRAEKEEDDKRWAAARRRRPEQTRETYTISEVKSYAMNGNVASLGVPNFEMSPPEFSPIGANEGSSFAPLASPSTSPSGFRTVWGTAAVQSASPVVAAVEPAPEPDGWLNQWERDLLEVGPMDENKPATGTGSKKKAKKQKITLMSTTGRRAA